MSDSPIARAQQDWRNGLSVDENPFPKNSPHHQQYAYEHHRLTYEQFIRECSELLGTRS